MRGHTIHDVLEFAAEPYFTGDPNTLNEPGRDGDILATNDGYYWIYDPDGNWQRILTSKVRWDDLRIPATALGVGIGGGTAASWAAISGLGNLRFLTFSASAINEVFGFAQLPHTWAGTAIKPHLHIIESGGTGTSRWGLEYLWVNPTGTATTPSTIYAEKVAEGVAGYHDIIPFASIAGTGKVYSSMLAFRLFREGNHVNDDLNSVASLLEFDIHYEKVSNGTIEEYPT